MTTTDYVHGYSSREATRLTDQAATLDALLHHDTLFASGSLVLEAGCGVGAQTRIIAPKNPGTRFMAIDLSAASLQEAASTVAGLGLTNVEFRQANLYELPFAEATFDSVIICFVLEHLADMAQALREASRVLKPGGTLICIEGDHGSTLFFPDSAAARAAIGCQVQLQRQNGGNADIGRALYPLLAQAGLTRIVVSPRLVYVDASRPELVEGFIKNTFIAMIEGVAQAAVERGLTDKGTFAEGIADLQRTTASDGVFSYTFFKAFATKAGS